MFGMQKRSTGGQRFNQSTNPIDLAINSENSQDFNLKLKQLLEKDTSSFSNLSLFQLNSLINNWIQFDLKMTEDLQIKMLQQLNLINFSEKANNLDSKKVKETNTKVYIIYGASKIMTKIRNQKQIGSEEKKQLVLKLITQIFEQV